MPRDVRRAVAIGGGTGLPRVLQCLLSQGYETSAVVTMADDGGSSGVLRAELDILPPGDIRNCLVAMAKDPDGPLSTLFQYRFPAGEGLAGHAIGNLALAALADITGSFPEAVKTAGTLLEVRGEVLPSTLEDLELHATDASGRPVRGQANIAVSEGPVVHVNVTPASPKAYGPALDAIRSADVIVVGPGSLFTSIIPNFLVDGVVDAMRDSSAVCVYVCNVANQRGETQGMDAAQHLEALCEHGLCGHIDVAVLHEPAEPDAALAEVDVCDDDGNRIDPVDAGAAVREHIEALGVRVVVGDLIDPEVPVAHSQERLCAVLREVF